MPVLPQSSGWSCSEGLWGQGGWVFLRTSTVPEGPSLDRLSGRRLQVQPGPVLEVPSGGTQGQSLDLAASLAPFVSLIATPASSPLGTQPV